jgi:hypothetical protein
MAEKRSIQSMKAAYSQERTSPVLRSTFRGLNLIYETELLWSWKTARPEWLAENIYTSEAHQTPTVTSDGSLVVPANLAGNH